MLCSQPHRLSQCGLFTGMQPIKCFKVAKRHRLCFNCLIGGHVSNTCYKQSINLDCVVRRELDIELMKSTFWTDSMVTLAYIQSDSRRFKTFVANRVSLIIENSTPDQWCHNVGYDNPADILSRDYNVSKLPTVWFEGPRFLSEYNSTRLHMAVHPGGRENTAAWR